jgi:DNA-binding transcriptional MerR regulator/methylmalonyl-CoA mutase cobalamin-binding subunit
MGTMVKSATSNVPAPEARSSDARYRIAAVAELTGVPEPTLRAWERRYGIPAPERTTSGYRLYGEAEIAMVREMRRLCSEGVAAAEAAKLVRGRARPGPPTSTPMEPVEGTLEASARAMLDAIERFDDAALDHEIRRAVFLGSATELLDRVLAPTLKTVGDRWHAGELTVAQEHLASQKLGTLMRDLVRLLPGADAADAVVLGSFADDEHDLGLLGVGLRLSAWGLRPVFLGARTPPAAVRNAVQATSPKLVALSVTVTPEKRRARELVDEYAAACGDAPWIVGGAGVAPLAERVTKAGGLVLVGGGEELAASLHAIVTRVVARASRGARRAR